jgi:lactoylglutathione lyase
MRLTHVRLLVEDFAASHRFYGTTLGLSTTWPDDGSYAEFDAGGVMIAIFPRTEMDGAVTLRPSGDAAALVIEVDDVDAAFTAAVERGGEAAAEPTDHPEWGLRTAHVRDPDGNIVELYQDIEWEQE